MTNYLIHRCAALLLAVVASSSIASAQLPADLASPASFGGLAVTNMSTHNGPGGLGAGGGGSRARGPVAVNLSLNVRLNSSTSRSSVMNKSAEGPVDTSTPSVWAGRKSASQVSGARARVSPGRPFSLDNAVSFGAVAPASFGSGASSAQSPLYSSLTSHENGGLRSGASQQSAPRRLKRGNSQRSLIHPLPAAGRGGSHR
jgi:hypothetical protein